MIYKTSYKVILINLLIVILLLVLVFFIKKVEIEGAFVSTVIIIGVYLFSLLLKKRPTKIETTQSNIVITFNQFLIFNIEKVEQLSELTQSFKREIGPRGIKTIVYRIYKRDITILKIVPSFNGWRKENLQILVGDLQKLGVNLVDQEDL